MSLRKSMENTKTMFRNDTCYGAGVIDLFDIIYYEVTELGNTDILDYCLEHYNLSDSTRVKLLNIEDIIGGCNIENNSENPAYDEFLLAKDGITSLLEEVSEMAGKCVKYGLWLADKDKVIELYDGNESNISEYEVSDVVLSELIDGTLFGYEFPPKHIK